MVTIVKDSPPPRIPKGSPKIPKWIVETSIVFELVTWNNAEISWAQLSPAVTGGDALLFYIPVRKPGGSTTIRRHSGWMRHPLTY